MPNRGGQRATWRVEAAARSRDGGRRGVCRAEGGAAGIAARRPCSTRCAFAEASSGRRVCSQCPGRAPRSRRHSARAGATSSPCGSSTTSSDSATRGPHLRDLAGAERPADGAPRQPPQGTAMRRRRARPAAPPAPQWRLAMRAQGAAAQPAHDPRQVMEAPGRSSNRARDPGRRSAESRLTRLFSPAQRAAARGPAVMTSTRTRRPTTLTRRCTCCASAPSLCGRRSATRHRQFAAVDGALRAHLQVTTGCGVPVAATSTTIHRCRAPADRGEQLLRTTVAQRRRGCVTSRSRRERTAGRAGAQARGCRRRGRCCPCAGEAR